MLHHVNTVPVSVHLSIQTNFNFTIVGLINFAGGDLGLMHILGWFCHLLIFVSIDLSLVFYNSDDFLC